MRIYMSILLVVSVVLGFEYWALDHRPAMSLLTNLQKSGLIAASTRLTTDPGAPLSYWLGWGGITAMLLMNSYTVRKKFRFLSNSGRLSRWLDFHVFCGLLGPILILFHCDLKARGIVGISFWSMIVSFSSGIIGRYFYRQLMGKKTEFEEAAAKWMTKFEKVLSKENIQLDDLTKAKARNKALAFVGARENGDSLNPIAALISSIAGDLRIMVSEPHVPREWPRPAKVCLVNFAVHERRSQFLQPFQRLMGHWHAFHFPFAVFMYIAAFIHIVSSLIFQKAG